MEKVRLGIVGFGNMGNTHYRFITEGLVKNMEITAVCDINPKKLEMASELLPGVPQFTNAEDLYKSGLCDAVSIATPHYVHPELAIKALENGLHVLCEKPAGVYTKQVNEMLEVAKKTDKLLAVNFCLRGLPVYQALRKLIKSGELGHIKRITWLATQWYRPQAYHDSAGWRSTWATEGGGALINQCPHQLDLWQWLFGTPDQLMADVSFGKYYDIEVDDDVSAMFKYDNGTTGVYLTGTGETPGTNRLDISCDMGRVVMENGKITFDKLDISEREWNAGHNDDEPTRQTIEIPVEGEDLYCGVFVDFANAIIEGRTELLSPGYEAINELTMSNAMYYSAWNGSKWIDLKSFPHDDFYNELMKRVATSKPKQGVEDRIYVTGGTK
ncbi:MAG: Gfo/Idh/MocA family oxidoreductase [Ruminococcaceae bacterium]|nr:Gfo/Idh/MocA family oxidoreductase [Oscillospiraceae bacterium]